MSVDIVNLIENNPITKLNGNYQSKLIEKLQKHFNNYEQQMFVASFYCYLKYDNKNDFVIDLDNVWNWLGFGQKINAKRVLEKNFTINKDYKLSLCQLAKQTTNTKGGQNKEILSRLNSLQTKTTTNFNQPLVTLGPRLQKIYRYFCYFG